MKKYWVYILSNNYRTVFYVGFTGNLVKRIEDHKNLKGPAFTKKYNVVRLLYFEEYTNPSDAILREKQLKRWKREWKENLILNTNPEFKDLFFEF